MQREDIIKQMERAGCGEGSKIPQTWEDAVAAYERFAAQDQRVFWPDSEDPLGQVPAREKYDRLQKEAGMLFLLHALGSQLKEEYTAELPALLQALGVTSKEFSDFRWQKWSNMRTCTDHWRARDKLAAAHVGRDRARALLAEALAALNSTSHDTDELRAAIREELRQS